MRQRLICLSLAGAVGAAAVVPAIASTSYADYLTLAAASSKSAAAETARAQHGGKVLKVEEASEGGRKVYRVKLLLAGGRIKIVTVDASGGAT